MTKYDMRKLLKSILHVMLLKILSSKNFFYREKKILEMEEDEIIPVSRSRSNLEAHPIEVFFDIRAEFDSVDSQFDTFIKSTIINKIPVLDKHKRNQLDQILRQDHRIHKVFNKFNIEIHTDIFKLVEIPQFISNSKYAYKINIMCIAYYVFSWYLNKSSDRNDSNVSFLLETFACFAGREKKLNTFEMYIFKKILKGTFDNDDLFHEKSLLRQFLTFIVSLNGLSYSLCHPIFKLFHRIKITHESAIIEDLKVYILHLCLKRDDLIISSDGSYVISVFANELSTLDPLSLQILAHLTHCVDINTILLDTFMSLPLPLYTFITKYPDFQNDEYKEPEIPKESPSIIYSMNDLAFMSEERTDFVNGFNTPNFSLINPQTDLLSYLPQQLKDICFHVAACYQDVNSKYTDFLIKSVIMVLKTSRGNYYHVEFCTAITYILILVAGAFPSKVSLFWFFETSAFNPAINVFDKRYKNEQIMVIRQNIFNLISKCIPVHIIEVFVHAQSYPLLFSEFILRVYEKIELFDISLFVKPEILNLIIQTMHQLLRLEPDENINIVEARQILIIFVSYLCSFPKTALACFSSKCFTDGFLWFIFESDLTSTIIRLIRNSISIIPYYYTIEMSVSYITMLFKAFKARVSKDIRYLTVAEELATSIVSSLRTNSSCVKLFEPNLHHFLSLIQDVYSEKILDASFYFIDLLARSQLNYTISITTLRDFTKAVKNTYGDEPPESVFKHLHSLISGQYTQPGEAMYLIRQKSAIPLLLSCFGCSRRFPQILETLYKLCQYSAFNKNICHYADLDYMLLKFISRRKKRAFISYKSVEIEIELDLDLLEELVFPILTSITSQKANAGIVSQYVNLMTIQVDDVAISTCKTVSSILQLCFNRPMPYILIGTIHPIFVVSNIPVNVFKDSFSLHFKCFVDIPSIEIDSPTINLLTFEDINKTQLSIYIEGKSIIAKFENADAISNVILVPTVPGKWFDFTVSCSVVVDADGDQNISMTPYLNGVPDVEFFLGSESFAGEYLTLTVGGLQNSDKASLTHQIGAMGNIIVFKKSLDEKEVVNLLHAQRDKSIELFSSDLLLEEGENIKILSNDITSHDFLWCASDYGIINDIVAFFRTSDGNCPHDYPGYLLDIMTLIFSYSEKCQRDFNGASIIQRFLFTNPQLLTSNIFFCAVTVMKSLTVKSLIVEWLTKIVLNMWIWIKAPYKDLNRIVYFLSHFMVRQFFDVFSTISLLSILCDQFFLLFCFKNEESFRKGDDLKLIPENSNATKICNFLEKIPVSTLFECREHFFRMICYLVPYKCDRFDIQTIVMHMFSAKSEYSKLFFMKLLCIVPDSVIKNFSDRIDTVTQLRDCLLSSNVDTVITTMKLILKLNYESSPMLNISFLYLAKNVPLEELFNKLLEELPDSQQFYQFICLFAIRLDDEKKKRAINEFNKISVENLSSLFCNNWYIWPLLLAYGCNNEDQVSMALFIGKVLLASPEFDTDLFNIFVLCNIFSSYSNTKNEVVTINIMQTILNYLSNKNISFITDSLFMRIKMSALNSALNEEFLRSPFSRETVHDDFKVMIQDVKTPDALSNFLSNNAANMSCVFSVRINEQGKWIDSEKALMILKGLHDPGLSQRIKLIRHFLQRDDESENIMSNSELIDEIVAEYNKIFKYSVLQLSTFVNKSINDAHVFSEYAEPRPVTEYISMSNTKIEIDIQEVQSFFSLPLSQVLPLAKDRTSCYCLCPMKLKRKAQNVKKNIELNNIELPIYSHKCTQIKITGNNQYIFKLYPSNILLFSREKMKVIDNKQIYMVLTRRINGRETGIELFLENGRSYLIDFIDEEHPAAINSFLQAKTPKMQILQRMVSAETFARMHATHRWILGLMSNFEYLVKMNVLAGRSFNDPHLYPIFPSFFNDINDIENLSDFTQIKKWFPPLTERIYYPSQGPLPSLEQCFAPNRFVVPDFFFFSHTIANKSELPSWANSEFEFVYKLRKILESNFVSKRLPMWIDSIFGIRVNKVPHRQLFRVDHPQKQPLNKSKQNHENFSFNIGADLIKTVYVIAQDISYITFCALLDSGKLIQFKITLLDKVSITEPKHVGTVGDNNYEIYDNYEDFLVVASIERQSIVTVKRKEISECHNFSFDTNIVIAADDRVIFCPNRATLSELSFNEDVQFSIICRAKSNIVCAAVEPRFKLVAVALANNIVCVYDFRTKRKVNSYNANDTVLKLLITSTFGFVVVQTMKDIVILSSDGEFIKRTAMPAEIVSWWKFVSPSGFDYVVFQDTENKLGFFDALYPESVIRFYETRSRVVWTSYDFTTERFVIIMHDGFVQFCYIHL